MPGISTGAGQTSKRSRRLFRDTLIVMHWVSQLKRVEDYRQRHPLRAATLSPNPSAGGNAAQEVASAIEVVNTHMRRMATEERDATQQRRREQTAADIATLRQRQTPAEEQEQRRIIDRSLARARLPSNIGIGSYLRTFQTWNEAQTMQRPQCVAYDAPSPNGRRLHAVPPNETFGPVLRMQAVIIQPTVHHPRNDVGVAVEVPPPRQWVEQDDGAHVYENRAIIRSEHQTVWINIC